MYITQTEWVSIARKHGASESEALDMLEFMKKLLWDVDRITKRDAEELWESIAVLRIGNRSSSKGKRSLWAKILGK